MEIPHLTPTFVPGSAPRDFWPVGAATGYQKMSMQFYVLPGRVLRGWVTPDLQAQIAGGTNPTGCAASTSEPRSQLPTFFPIANRGMAGLNGGPMGPGYNAAGGITAKIVPPDRYWRARTSPRKASHDVKLGIRQNLINPRTKTPLLSFGS